MNNKRLAQRSKKKQNGRRLTPAGGENQNIKELKHLNFFDDFLLHVMVLFLKILSSSDQTIVFGRWIWYRSDARKGLD